jgi:DHA1 family bicyclomycin/chloramphenicol resistance-like MFS transporter
MLRPDTLALTILLATLTALGPLSTDMYLPSLPTIGRVLGASTAEVQLTLSVYLFAFAIGQIVYGPLSDRHGRKPVLLGALALFVLASLACALASSIELLIVARFVQACGGAGAIVLARAVVRDLYSGVRAGRELSLMSAIMGIAPMLAPLSGGALETAFGWRSSFFALVGCGVFALGMIWLLLPETLAIRAPEPVSIRGSLRIFAGLVKHRVFAANIGLSALSFAGIFVWISASSVVLQNIYGLTPMQFGIAFAITGGGYFSGTLLATRLLPRLGLDRTMGIGATALAVSGVAMMLVLMLGIHHVAAIVGPMAVSTCGLGLLFPQAIAGALNPFPDRAGAASSLIGFIQQTFAAAVSAAIGFSLGSSAWPMAATIAALGVLTFTLWLTSRRARAA